MARFDPTRGIMPERNRAMNDKPGEGSHASGSSESGLNAQSRPTSSSTGQISKFVEWIKPYKELVALLGAAVMALSGGVSFAVSHFATVEQLSSLECRMSVSTSTQWLPMKINVLAVQIES